MRLFLAVEIPAPMRAAVERLAARLRGECRGWKWVASGSIHLTLRFLGDVFPDDVPEQSLRFRDAVDDVAAFRYRLEGVGVFPKRSHPRVLWAGVEEVGARDRLAALAGRLESAARAAGLPAEERAFRPHLTLARAEAHGRAVAPPERFDIEPVEAACSEVVLFRSELRPEGARYTPLASFTLARESTL